MITSTVTSSSGSSYNDHAKLCIICCHHKCLSSAQANNADKISKIFAEFSKVKLKEKEGDDSLNVFRFTKNDICSGDKFGSYFCESCLMETNKLITLKDKVISLEDNVISLQKQIIKGLRDLEDCLKEIKCHQKNLEKKFKQSDESSLQSTCESFPLKLRRWIMKEFGQNGDGKLKGNLWIPEEPLKQAVVKTEPSAVPEEDSFDFEEDSSNLWNNDDDGNDKEISTLKNELDEKLLHQDQISNTSRMTLRTRTRTIKKSEVDTEPISNIKSRKRNIIRKSKHLKKVAKSNIVSNNIKKTPISPQKKKAKVLRSCELCPLKTRDDPCYEQHIREHETEEKTLQCPECPLKFSTNQYLKFHQKCHQGLLRMSCDICRKFIPVLDLATHIKSHFISKGQQEIDEGTSPPKIIYCQNCSFCCTKREVYLTHIRRHFAGRKIAGKFSCDICSKEYPNPSGLLKHFHESHEGTLDKWTCDYENCGKTFPCRQYLVTHKWQHTKEDSVSCSKCDKKFPSVPIMKAHFRVHSGEKPFSCDECGESYRLKSSLDAHKRREHGAAKFKCKICGKEYSDPAHFKYHVNKHENKGFHCETCGKIFGNVHMLRIHLLSHSDEKRMTCDKCGKMFKGSTALRIHMKVHSGVKNWKCEYCGKAFVRRENLTDHLRVHTGERPFVCEICGKDFNQASALKTHKKNQHQI